MQNIGPFPGINKGKDAMTTTKRRTETENVGAQIIVPAPAPVRNPGMPLDMDWVRQVRVNRSAVERRATTIPTRRTVKKEWQAAWLLRAITCIDLTTLQGDDTPGNVLRLCAKARHPVRQELLDAMGVGNIEVGAVCVYHNLVRVAVEALRGSDIPVAAVSTGFPAGQISFDQKLEEIVASVKAGAREIDIVISRAHVLTGNWQALYDEVQAFRAACGDAHMKTILATYELATLRNVAMASLVCMMAGADFVKTSTGKEPVNATLPVGVVMVRAIREYYEQTGYKVGFKPAGGVRSARQALDWLILMKEELGNQWVKPASGQYIDSINPATGKRLAQVAAATGADVDAAVAAARAAFETWSKAPGHVRARYIYAIARHIQKHSRLLAVLESLDNGKPIRETRDIDIPLVARHFYYYAGWAQLMELQLPDYQPVGVVGQIIPWNFPLLMLAWKIAPALAMGNTVVLKPARYTSLTALKFAEIMQEIGIPPGVVNILTGEASQVGEALVRHPDVNKIAFTGSTDVGRNIRRATAGSGKKLSLELGGKSPFIVFDDADLDSVVEGVVDAIWFNQGQVCCAGSRLLMQENIADRLVAKLRTRMEHLRIGDSLDKAVDIGAIVSPGQLKEIQRLVHQGVEEGAEMWQPSWACPTEGYFFPPTLFTNVSPATTIAQVEIFGPVLVAMTFRTPEEAVALASNTRYGLAASVWSENINLALDVAPKLKAGSVWINCTNLFDASSGFGGYRESGYGREGGKEGLYEYVRPAWEAKAAQELHIAEDSGNGVASSNGSMVAEQQEEGEE